MLGKANAILSLFSADRPELPAPEVARLLRRPRSTVYRILGEMASEGFLDLDPGTGRYRLGIRLAMLGELARASTSLQRVAHQALLDLTRATGEMSTLMVLSGGEGVTVDLVESYQPIKIPAHLGGRFPLHATAGGKVLLTGMSEEGIGRLLAAPLAPLTKTTITDPSELRKEIEAVRKAGFGTSEREWLEDVCALAAPVRDHRGVVIAAVGVALGPHRWKQAVLRELTATLVKGAARLSRLMGFSPVVMTAASRAAIGAHR